MDSQRVFEQNYSALRKRNPVLAERLRTATTEGIELVTGPRGDVVVRERGVLLGSAYDPRRDGQRLSDEMASQAADIVVAVGFGLGDQFPAYCDQRAVTVIVYEPSLARLKAGLSRILLAPLLQAKRDFHLVADLDQLTTAINARYVSGLCIRVFPHPAVLRLDAEAVAAAVDRTKRVKDAADTQIATSVSQLMPWAWITAGNGRRIAESAHLGSAAGMFRAKTAVVAAAGPSLDKQLPLLRAHRDRVVVIAIGQTLRALREAGIEPDLVHILESKDVSQQLTGAGDTTSLCVALTPDAHSAIFDVPVRARFTATTGSSPMGTWIARATGETRFTIGGGTVAQGAVGLAVLLGCDPILLIGQDLAFTDGRAYAKGSAYDFVRVEMNDDGTCAYTEMDRKDSLIPGSVRFHQGDKVGKGRIVWVDGWYEGEKVPTWGAYASFIEQYRDIGLALSGAGHRLVNCTEGGARIPMVDHRPFREMLEAIGNDSFDARAELIARHDARSRRTLEDYRNSIDQARARLDALEREVEKARELEERTRARLPHVRSDQQRLEILRAVARCEKRIRTRLADMRWLDALVQPEIYAALASQRKSENQTWSIEDLVADAKFLIDAAANAVERGRHWFETFERSFASDAGSETREPSVKPETVTARSSEGRMSVSLAPL